ncbi:MAG: hypothetical protein PHS80_08105 [Methanothrix sp.]|nr:hypothetical protein [Methanothrix sp.]MDD4447465.1 hypothetical protein [Methanothrix sp.]
MRYMKLFVSLAALCLLAGFALAAQNGNGPSASAGCSNENCINGCENQGTCSQENCQAGMCQGQNCKLTGAQDGSGNQKGNGQNGNPLGPKDGSGPRRDGSCQT